jgi:integrase
VARKPKPRNLGTKVEESPDFKGQFEDWEPWGKIYVERHSRVPGTGSFDTVKRGKYTYLRARVWINNPKGIRERKEVYGSTQRELTQKLKALQDEPRRGDVKKLTVVDFLTHSFLPAVKLRAKSNTYRGYENAIRLHIVPHIGKAKLAKLTASNVDAWLADLDAKPRAKQNAFVTLKVALNYAVRDLGFLDRNPIDRMKAPRAPKAEQRILTLPEVKKLLKAAEGSGCYPFVYLAIATSMRFGELCALDWSDVDLTRGFLHVKKGLGAVYDDETKSGYRREITDPKSAASRRRIDLSSEAVALLKSHRKSQNGAPNPLDLVFPNDAGSFIHESNFTRRVWGPLLKQAKPPHCTFHPGCAH